MIGKLLLAFLGVVAAHNHTGNGTTTGPPASSTAPPKSSTGAPTNATAKAAFEATQVITVSINLPSNITAADLYKVGGATALTPAAKAFVGALETAYAGVVGVPASDVTVTGIAAGRRRRLEERRLAATALKVTYKVVFADATKQTAYETKAKAITFEAFNTEFDKAVKADATLAGICGPDNSGCAADAAGFTAAAPALTKDGKAVEEGGDGEGEGEGEEGEEKEKEETKTSGAVAYSVATAGLIVAATFM